jgi:hypothetical protein
LKGIRNPSWLDIWTKPRFAYHPNGLGTDLAVNRQIKFAAAQRIANAACGGSLVDANQAGFYLSRARKYDPIRLPKRTTPFERRQV